DHHDGAVRRSGTVELHEGLPAPAIARAGGGGVRDPPYRFRVEPRLRITPRRRARRIRLRAVDAQALGAPAVDGLRVLGPAQSRVVLVPADRTRHTAGGLPPSVPGRRVHRVDRNGAVRGVHSGQAALAPGDCAQFSTLPLHLVTPFAGQASVQASPCDDLRYSLAAGLPQSPELRTLADCLEALPPRCRRGLRAP